MNPADSTMLITGASQGIGQFLAIYFSRSYRKVYALARNQQGLQETVKEATAADGRAEAFVANLTDTASLRSVADELARRGESVDVLINNAADTTSKPFLESTDRDIQQLVATNVIGPLQLTRMLVPQMADKSDGIIVNISSLAGYKPNPAQTVYSVTKSAVNGMSDALRTELAPLGIHVMNVALASVGTYTDTRPGQVPVALFAQALERAIAERRDELFLSATSKWLMRLYRFLPGLAKLT